MRVTLVVVGQVERKTLCAFLSTLVPYFVPFVVKPFDAKNTGGFRKGHEGKQLSIYIELPPVI
jgi:hypothetical protein